MRRSIFAAIFLLLASALFAQNFDPDLQPPKPPISKIEEKAKFHTPDVIGTPAAVRMEGWEQRKRMLAQSPFSQIKWRNIGPEWQGGRVVAVQSPLKRPEQLLLGFATGGLWRTSNEGATWEPLFENESSFGIGDFDVTADGNTIYVGTGEANSQRTSYAGTGVFKSTDAGKSWTNVGLPESQHIGKVVISPRDPNTVYVAVLGNLYSQSKERGLYKTTDGGLSWKPILQVDRYTGSIDVVLDPRDSNVLYAVMWDRDRRAWNFRESGPGSGAYKSTDGGRTWKKLEGLPSGEAMGRTGLSICETKPNVVYAYIDNQAADEEAEYRDERAPSGVLTPRRFRQVTAEQFQQIDRPILEKFVKDYLPEDTKLDDLLTGLKEGKLKVEDVGAMLEKRNADVFRSSQRFNELWRSDDSGKTWRRTHTFALGDFGGYYTGKVSVNPRNPDEVYVMGWGLIRSTDGGKSFKSVARNNHADHHVLWFDPRTPGRIVNGNDGGAYLSMDGGETWRHFNNLPTAQATTLAIDTKTPYNVYIGLQDNGTMRGPSTYVPGQSRPEEWKAIGGGDGSAIAVDPRGDGDTVYIASQFGSHVRLRQSGSGQNAFVRPPDVSGLPPARYNWISPIRISPHHPDIVYIGSQRLNRSLNQGGKWETLGGDLTKNKPNGDVPYSTIKDISESPFQFGLLYVGTDDGNVRVTKNHGSTWENIDTPMPNKWVARVVAGQHDKATVYCAQTGYREDDFTPYLWKSTDYGKTWKNIASNLPMEPINVVREDPTNSNILYVGTDMGVYVTFDGGKIWEPLAGGMPSAPVHDLVVAESAKELVAATHSRGVFILKLKDVYATTPELRAKELELQSVNDVVRRPNWGLPTGSGWDDTYFKPTIRGQFWSKSAGKGSLRILGKDGKVVKEQPLDVAVGHNYFTMDLETAPGKYVPGILSRAKPKDAKEAVADPFESLRPQFVPIGEYKIEVAVNGKTSSVDWAVKAP